MPSRPTPKPRGSGPARGKKAVPSRAAPAKARAEVDARKLVHELEVHQIELQMQNEELKTARFESELTSKRYLDLFDFAPIGYARLDPAGKIVEINHSGARLLGQPRASLIARSFRAFLAAKDVGAFDRVRNAGTPGEEQRCEAALRGEGPPTFIRFTLSALRGAGPTTLVSFEDITEHRLREEALARSDRALREADRRKDEFIAMLSHELRNPLTPIQLGLRVLAPAVASDETARRAHEIMERQVQHLASLVDDLMDVTRVARGKITLHRRGVELGDLVRRAVEDNLETFRSEGISLPMSLPRRAVWVTGDPVRLIQVINNLLGNALKYTPRGGTVSVSLEASGGHATVRVRDDGAGISRDLIGALFEPFVQGPQPIDRGAGGLGLGLAMVKGLIELHGGRVSVESAGFNRGSEFIIELPSTTPPAERGMAGPERAPRALRILVIEDNLDSAEVLKQALQLTGHVVALAAAGPEGIELARRFNPEVVLCDLGLPGMSGYSVAEAFRSDASLREIFLVALSGYTQPAAIQSARQAGFNRHVAKPPDLNLLLSMLAEVPVAPAARSAPDEILH